MTPEQQRQFAEMYAWFKQRQVQQISFPVDEASRNALGVVTRSGPGSSTKTQSVLVSGTPSSITVPAAYAGTIILLADGVPFEIPYL